MNELSVAGHGLGSYLRDRRTRLDPAAFGFPAERRRTPGLRREEVAQRANISPTWYAWLEQGRGGALSQERGRHPAAAACSRPPEPQPGGDQDRNLGRRRLEPGGDRDADGLW